MYNMSALDIDMLLKSSHRSFCKLNINLSPELHENIYNLYLNAIKNHNNNTYKAIFCNERLITDEVFTFDAGFDLFAPNDLSANPNELIKINHQIQTSMSVIDPKYNLGKNIHNSIGNPVGYYLYPRSSTGTKTPLRLANSVGIIDSGYRGNIIAAFDNKSEHQFNIEKGQRLVQICPPNLEYPLWVELVDQLDNTERGAGGFGSTGV
jgi:dUTP pyrophosphatase